MRYEWRHHVCVFCLGGRASDKKITCAECLDVLSPGEAVMADPGFVVEEEVEARGCKLHIPTFLTAH